MTALLPVVFVVVSLVSFEFPGDEYGLWVVGNHAGIPGLLLLGNSGDIGDIKFRAAMAASGAVVFAAVGFVLDWLRVGRRRFLLLALGWWGILVGAMLLKYPSMARAIAKNGSLEAYVFASIAPGIELAALCLIVVHVARRLFFGGRRVPQSPTVAREDDAR